MRYASILFALLCMACFVATGCGDGKDDKKGSESPSPSGGSSSPPSGQQGLAAHGGVSGAAKAVGGIGGSTTPPGDTTPSGSSDGNTGGGPSGDFALTKVAPESLVPNPDFFAGESGGNPVLLFKTPSGEAGERDLSFLGKFPSTNSADYSVRVEMENRQQANMDRALNVVSVAGTKDKITIKFPPASGANGLFDTMTLFIKYKDKEVNIKIHIP
jgi:hypothetical protein